MLNSNFVDLLILGILAYFAFEGYRIGFWGVIGNLLSFIGSLVISLRTYPLAAEILRSRFSFSHSASNALAFLLVALLAEIILGYLAFYALRKVPLKMFKHPVSKVLGILPSIGEGLVVIAFLLTFIMTLPIRPFIKEVITESQLGSAVVSRTVHIERAMNEIFGGVIEESLTYLTIKPQSNESISLNTEIEQLTVDEVSETAMFTMVNQERVREGVRELRWDPSLVTPARAHARDMWERRYFSHVSPDGEDVGDRLQEHNVRYFLAGENLAMAPTLKTAHEGLMNSPGHRANILSHDFGRVGIGVIDNGIYGKMFVQVFAD